MGLAQDFARQYLGVGTGVEIAERSVKSDECQVTVHDSSQKPWLKHGDLLVDQGVLFMFCRSGECNHCGECCKGDVWKHLSREQQIEYERLDFNGGYCYWYDRERQRCKIYADRPNWCLLFPETPDQMPDECSYRFKLVQLGVLR